MKKKHSYQWCQDTKDEDMCLSEEEMGEMDMDMCEEQEKMTKPMMHMHGGMHEHMMHTHEGMHEHMMDMHEGMHGHMMDMHEGMHGHTMHMHKNMCLAHAYVPWQCYHKAFSPGEALCKGTLFPELFGVYRIPK